MGQDNLQDVRRRAPRSRIKAGLAALAVNVAFAAALFAVSQLPAERQAERHTLIFVSLPQTQHKPAPLSLPPVSPEAIRLQPPAIAINTPADVTVPAIAAAQKPALSEKTALRYDPLAAYIARVSSDLGAVKRYPWSARLARQEGTVLLHLSLSRSGKVIAWKIERHSNSPALDTEVGDMVHRAEPFASFPRDLNRDQLDVIVPIEFSLHP